MNAQGKPGCDTQSNPSTGYEWPALKTETMTMWVRPETPAATRFGSPAMSGAPLCFDADSVEANRATQNAFCKARGFDVHSSRSFPSRPARASRTAPCD